MHALAGNITSLCLCVCVCVCLVALAGLHICAVGVAVPVHSLQQHYQSLIQHKRALFVARVIATALSLNAILSVCLSVRLSVRPTCTLVSHA